MSGDTFRAQHPLAITRAESRVLDALRRGPGPYTAPALLNHIHNRALYSGDQHVIAVHICRLRKALAPHGVEIENVHKAGYRIHTDGRAKLDALLGPVPRVDDAREAVR